MGFAFMVDAVGGMRVEWKVIGELDGARRGVREERLKPQVLSSQSIYCRC